MAKALAEQDKVEGALESYSKAIEYAWLSFCGAAATHMKKGL
jgi:hypothetical protein